MKSMENLNTGGKAAKNGKGPLWTFLPENDGSFLAPFADHISRLYFPLMNHHGMKCSITPELKGDMASAFQNYLTAPTVTEELHRNISGRNFWIKIKGQAPWSATGNSVFQRRQKWSDTNEYSEVEGKIGAFISRRKSEDLGIEAEISVFVPNTDDHVELMKVSITNKTKKALTYTATAATALFGRHADNFRDHRQVTTMFQKTFIEKNGVRIKPLIVHDEHGHGVNKVQYAVLGFEEDGSQPDHIWPLLKDFIGEGGSLDNPEVIYHDLDPPVYAKGEYDGQEAIGALQFREKILQAGETASYIILHGITEDEKKLKIWGGKFGKGIYFDAHLKDTLSYWNKLTTAVSVNTADDQFDNWVKWVSYQIKCRQIFGNSYLPDFGYGRGGRGWRDLWQDLLSIFLVDPESAKEEMVNSLKGIRVDGSNATIIGTEPGTFIADRNNVPRTWCDHGAWPVFAINFYIEQTGDVDILLQDIPYWKDQFSHRSKKRDPEFNPAHGNKQKTSDGNEYHGSILEHLLIQQLSAFYNVGEHNILLLEGGDWNDTYDMARERGESTGFYAFYAENLKIIARWLEALADRGLDYVPLLKEINALLNTNGHKKPYTIEAKQQRLQAFFDDVQTHVSGEYEMIGIQTLILDLILKAEHIIEVVREQEWVQLDKEKGFFNGHYDNLGQPVDGEKGDRVMIDLTTQVMSTMHDMATKEQLRSLMKAADRYLKDGRGYRLCTPFTGIDLNVGRITGFVYGHKEHGSKWMQQNIMLAYGLYHQGFSGKAFEVLNDAYLLSTDSATSKIFPGLPSYFEPGDRGAYAYLTGSSTWFILTLVTKAFGVRGELGHLCLHPQLHPSQFDESGKASITMIFRGKKIKVVYQIEGVGAPHSYSVKEISINGNSPELADRDEHKVLIEFKEFEELCNQEENLIEVSLHNIA
jgi:cellobiose phosphorylase